MKTVRTFMKWSALAVVLVGSISAGVGGALEAQMNTLKEECKGMISGTRYEGSKITYYTVGTKQTKTIELFMFLNNEYHFAVSAKKSTPAISLKIYDAAEEVEGRKLIKEIKRLNGQMITFTSTELNESYRKKVAGVDRLKNIFLEYHIGSGKTEKEGLVLVYGSKP